MIVPQAAYQEQFGRFDAGASALIMLHRVAFFDDRQHKLDETGERALLRWATEHRLGQDDELTAHVAARRAMAVAQLRRQGMHALRLHALPEWRLVVGLGNKTNAYEIGLSLHGSYGWPVIPGSSLKGLAAAWAVASRADPAHVCRVLGWPRSDVSAPTLSPESAVSPAPEMAPAQEAAADPDFGQPGGGQAGAGKKRLGGRGSVCFLDAIPAGSPAQVDVDVLTPHVKDYYENTAVRGSREPVPPAEYHNPVPVHFLTVAGAFAVDLYGPSRDDVKQAAQWLTAAGDRLGVGGKTAAGYGYLAITELPGDGGIS
jgi:CRISPR type III-B/RAMP module RAMP protein Cmr6